MIPSITPLESVTGRATRSYLAIAATTSSRLAVAGRLTSARSSMSAILLSGSAMTSVASRMSFSNSPLSSTT
jgi:hypothetical protein